MKLDTRPLMMILAVAMASTGCGDDGQASDGGGSTGASSSGTTGDDTMQSTSSNPTMGSTSSDDTTSGTTAGSSDDSGTTTGTSTGSADETGTSTSTGSIETVTLSGIVTDFGSPDPLPGIEVCVFGEDIPCATTDATGGYTLDGVPVAEGAIEFSGAGRFPSLFWGEGPMEDQTLNYNLLSTLAANVLAAVLGAPIDDELGHLAIAVADGEGALLSGVTFTMTPDSGAVGYLTTDGIDPDLTATSEVGFAGWLNVDIGEVEITASHPTLTCVPGPGALVGATPDALRIDITAGYLGSTFPFVCS